ncbi:hypothetical protein AB0M95_18625 [Sphaerisporangium sp. NPDC051017]|uniref:hypothetical protein n=1 Tax=Sphaerisporangium sp. NPDC051017 TaxID=3154636 RepID=UPI003440CF48
MAALLDTDTGTPVTLTTSFDAVGSQAPHLEIHGAECTLVLPDPNFHDGHVLHRAYGSRSWDTLPPAPISGPSSRGLGVLDLANALREAREPRCSARRAERVVHLIDAIVRTAELHIPTPSAAPAHIPITR